MGLLALAALAGCSSNSHGPSPATTASQPAAKYDPATAATITGTIHFAGVAPTPKPINMAEDPDCHGQNQDESLVVNNGKLANVVVYVKSGLPDSGRTMAVLTSRRADSDDSPDPRSGIIRQRGCRYVPHVVAVLKGQRVTIFNNDQTTHNIHPIPHANHEWNASQQAGAEPLVKIFNEPEVMIPVKCNVHPWMRAYINVFKNPFFAETDEQGIFRLPALPPGTYTIAAVHESLGEQTMQVTVGPKENREADFTFRATPNSASAAK